MTEKQIGQEIDTSTGGKLGGEGGGESSEHKRGQLERERGRGSCLKMEWKHELGKTEDEIWSDVPDRVEAIRKASSEMVKSKKK